MMNTELSRARWLAAMIGFLCATALVVQFAFSCLAIHLVTIPLRYSLRGKPLPPFTAWINLFCGYLPNSNFGILIGLFAAFLFSYFLLLIAVRRVSSVASVALAYSLWLGLLSAIDLLIISSLALAWATAAAYRIEPMLSR